jgi:Glycogen debranching enzyme
MGDPVARDTAYHQGTVWPWLIGPFFTAKMKIQPCQAEAAAWLAQFAPHLSEAGVGQVSEIFDGDPPHAPRGCIAQAWSVAELLRLGELI